MTQGRGASAGDAGQLRHLGKSKMRVIKQLKSAGKCIFVFPDDEEVGDIMGIDGNDFDVDAARAHFPALKQDQVFFDNAGGSQVLGDAIDS